MDGMFKQFANVVSDDVESSKALRRLKSDLKEASKLLKRKEARFLIDLYYQVQDFRIQSGNQITALNKDSEPISVLTYFNDSVRQIEDQIKYMMGQFSSEYAIGNWLQSICGIGPVLSAAFLTTFTLEGKKAIVNPKAKKSDPIEYEMETRRSSGAWYAYAGIAPGIEWKKGEKRPFDARAKVFCFKAGESFVKVQNKKNDFYGKLYASQKEYYLGKNENGGFADAAKAKLEKFKIGKSTDAYKAYSDGKLPPAHIHAMARRYAVKIFLSHLHDLCWEDFYKGKAPCPYVFSNNFKGGIHSNFIEPPNREFMVGRPLSDLYE